LGTFPKQRAGERRAKIVHRDGSEKRHRHMAALWQCRRHDLRRGKILALAMLHRVERPAIRMEGGRDL